MTVGAGHAGRHPRAHVHAVRAPDDDPGRRGGAGAPRRPDLQYDVEAILAGAPGVRGRGHDRLLAQQPDRAAASTARRRRGGSADDGDGLVVIDEAYHEFSGRAVVPLLADAPEPRRPPHVLEGHGRWPACASATCSPRPSSCARSTRRACPTTSTSSRRWPRSPPSTDMGELAASGRPAVAAREELPDRALRGPARRAAVPVAGELLPDRAPRRRSQGGVRGALPPRRARARRDVVPDARRAACGSAWAREEENEAFLHALGTALGEAPAGT